jgi:hypothetical protein
VGGGWTHKAASWFCNDISCSFLYFIRLGKGTLRVISGLVTYTHDSRLEYGRERSIISNCASRGESSRGDVSSNMEGEEERKMTPCWWSPSRGLLSRGCKS